jgi:tryptophan 2,3-dioxygenase
MDDGTTNRAVTYGSYLRVDELLELQQPRSTGPEHDELLFIVIHQVYELWFKELLHELDRVRQLLTADDTHRAQHTLKRILTILKVLVAQLDILETMTPLEFKSFRTRLEAASGFQSDQFRQIEFVLGVKSDKAIRRFLKGRGRAPPSSAAITNRQSGTRFFITSHARVTRCRQPTSRGMSPRRHRHRPESRKRSSCSINGIRRMPSCASGSLTSTRACRSGGIAT